MPGSNDLSAALVTISVVLYSAILIVIYGTVAFRRDIILRLINYGVNFKNHWKKNESTEKCLLYHILTKILLDIFVVIPIVVLHANEFIITFNFPSFLCLFFNPVAAIGYFFMTSMYCISFVFGLFHVQNFSSNLDNNNFYEISFLYQEVHKYLRKINSLMGFVIFLTIFQAFVALVGEVSVPFMALL